MITLSFLLVLGCSSYLLVMQTLLPRTIAVRLTPNADGFMIENHRTRTRTRQNYMVQRALDDELSANVDNLAPMSDTIDTEANPDELSSQIVDYANMIRNDIIYLDNSVETTTRKRGNIKKKNLIPELPCSCESGRDPIFLGENFFPTRLESRKCLEGTCPSPYSCKPNYYWVIVLKRLTSLASRSSSITVPPEFHPLWEAHGFNVTTSCACTADTTTMTHQG